MLGGIIDLQPPGLGFVLLFCWILFLWISVKNLSEDSISTVGPIVHLARTHITFNYPPGTTHTKLIFVNKNVKIFVIPIKISSNSWTSWKGLGSRTENCLNGMEERRYFLWPGRLTQSSQYQFTWECWPDILNNKYILAAQVLNTNNSPHPGPRSRYTAMPWWWCLDCLVFWIK